jgi:predicted nucleic acid-binding protein
LPSYFFYTSALVKLYHSEPGAKRIEEIFRQPENSIIIARLTLVEMESAFSIKIRKREISAEQLRQARARFYLDLAGRLKYLAMNDIHFSLARKLVLHYGADKGLRTLDALQLAVASELRSAGLIDFLVSADAALANVARAEEIPVINPLTN